MQFLTIIKIILELLPALIDAIKAIENAIPGSGLGEQKLAMIRSMIESVFNMSKNTVVVFEQVWPALDSVIKTVVSTFNTTGVFKK